MEDNYRNNKKYHSIELDGLRGIAIIAVIINNLNTTLFQSGYLGVDIFFVINGYLITASLQNKYFRNFKEFFFTFLERRLRRLLPSLLVMFLIISLATFLLVPNSSSILKTGIYSLFGISNFYLFSQSIDFFGEASQLNIFTNTWALAIHKQFYLIFPFIFWFSGYGKSNGSDKKLFTHILLVLCFFSFILFIFFYKDNFSASYFLFPFRFWEIAVGCLIFLKKDNKKIININYYIPLLGLIGILFLPNNYGPLSNTIIVIMVALFLENIKEINVSNNLLTNKFLVRSGLLSYSLYLWQGPIISLCRWTFNQSNLLSLSQIFLIILISIINKKYIEKRYNKYKLLKNKNINIFIILISNVIISFLIAIIYFLDIFPKLYKSNIKAKFSAGGSEKCMYMNPKICLGKLNKSPSLFAIGDSRMANFIPSLKAADFDYKYNIYFWGGPSHIRDVFSKDCLINDCYKKDVDNIINILEQNDFNKNDILLYSISRNRLYANKNSNILYEYGINNRNNKENKFGISLLKKAINKLSKFASIDKGGKVILIDDIPLACKKENWIKAHSFFIKETCEVSQTESLLDRKPLTNLLKEISNSNKNVFYIDPHSVICPDEICPIIFNKKPLYKDITPHLSLENKKIFKLFFEKEINKI